MAMKIVVVSKTAYVGSNPTTPAMKYTYATLLSTDDYIWGIIGLNYSLKLVNTKYPLLCIATTEISQFTLNLLKKYNIEYVVEPHLSFIEESCYQTTLNKVYAWTLDYDKILYLDGDLIIEKNMDYLFDYPAPIFKYAVKYNFEQHISVVTICGECFLIAPNKKLFEVMSQEYFLKNDEEILDKYFLQRYLPTYDFPQVIIGDEIKPIKKRYWENVPDIFSFIEEYTKK